jgi:hypothetical protein
MSSTQPPLDPTANAMAALLLDNAPNSYCYPCLASKFRVTEKEVRDAAQALVILVGFQVTRLRCANCGADGDLLQTPSTDPPRR